MKWSLIVLLCLASPAFAQPWAPAYYPWGPQSENSKTINEVAKALEKRVTDDAKYLEAAERAAASNKQLVVFVNTPERPVQNSIVIRLNAFQKSDRPRIILYTPDGKGWLGYVGSYSAKDETLEGVSQSALPFDPPSKLSNASPEAQDDGDNAPWLSRAETERIRSVLPRGMVGKDTKFYSLAPLYQKLTTMNNGQTKVNDITPLDHHEPAELTLSGGMASIPHHRWSSYKGLDIPSGTKIDVWSEDTDVRAFALVPRWRWSFPRGTIAYDVLANDRDEVFEIRTQEKEDEGWATKVVFRDKDKAPEGYNGIEQSCASCHSRTGEVRDVAGQLYRYVAWGSDGRYSWRPFNRSGSIDTRWPIKLYNGVYPSNQTTVGSIASEPSFSYQPQMSFPAGRRGRR